MRVLDLIRSPRGFAIVPVHYSHDPAKDDAWFARERGKYSIDGLTSADWDREMEIDFTAQSGVRVYQPFRPELHCVQGLEVVPHLPLRLCCDFNVSPCVFVVAQVVRSWVQFIGQVKLAPATVSAMVREFRNLFPNHPAEVWVYGDAAGRGRDVQTGQSDYDLLQAAFRGYSSAVVLKIPKDNPRVKDRVNAVNAKLMTADGVPGIRIDPVACPELVRDLAEVVWNPKQTDIHKVTNPRDPYHERTHASDAAGYLIAWEWPTIQQVVPLDSQSQPRPPRVYGNVLGALR